MAYTEERNACISKKEEAVPCTGEKCRHILAGSVQENTDRATAVSHGPG